MEFNLELFTTLFFIFLIWASKNLKRPLFLISTLVVAYGLLTMTFPQLFAPYFAPVSQVSAWFTLASLAARATIFIVILLLIPTRIFSIRTTEIFAHLSVCNALYMLGRYLLGLSPYSMGLCFSVDGMLVAIMYPMVILFSTTLSTRTVTRKIFKFLYLVIPVVAIFVVHGSTGMGGLCIGLFILFINRDALKILSVPFFLLLTPFLFFISAYFYKQYATGYSIFHDSSRFICWRWSMEWWWSTVNHWIGSGLGTYTTLGPFIQMETGNHLNSWFIEMHNDWLQCLFEMGYIGFSAVVSFVFYCLYKARNRRYLLASMIVYACSALIYYPCHNTILAAFGVVLIKESLDRDT